MRETGPEGSRAVLTALEDFLATLLHLVEPFVLVALEHSLAREAVSGDFQVVFELVILGAFPATHNSLEC